MIMKDQSKSGWLKLLEMLEGVLLPQEPFRVSKFHALFLKYYIKFIPIIFSLIMAGLVAWSLYSDSESIGSILGYSIFVGVLVYVSGLIAVWLSKKLYLNYIPGYKDVVEFDSKDTVELKTYKGLRLFWFFSGAVSAFVVLRVFYHYHGLLGLILPILLYLPSLAISLWVSVRIMEGSPIHPTRIIYRIGIIAAFIITLIFFLWWILEISNGLWGTLGIVIVAVISVCISSLILWTRIKRIQK